MAALNGIDTDRLRDYVTRATADPSVADRDPVVIARWMGANEAEVRFPTEHPIVVGGDHPSAMRLVLAALAACDIEVVATHATLLGVEIDSLTIEASGHFNVSRLVGIDADEAPGYQRIGYTVRLKTRGATPEQLAALERACEHASPLGDTMQRSVPLTLRFDAS